MEQKLLIISCVEYYSFLKNVPANNVFLSFHQASILEMLLESNRSFPEMDLEFYAGLIDGIIAMESDAEENDYRHYTERIQVVVDVVTMLEEKYGIPSSEACALYYTSSTAKLVSEDHTGLYEKSAQEIFDMIAHEV